jgi:hypothetical protein
MDYCHLFYTDDADDSNALRVFNLQCRIFPGLNMDHPLKYSNIMAAKDVPFNMRSVFFPQYTGAKNSTAPAPNQFWGMSEPAESTQPTPTPSENPNFEKGTMPSDGSAALPTPTATPAETALSSPPTNSPHTNSPHTNSPHTNSPPASSPPASSPPTASEHVTTAIPFTPNSYFACPVMNFNPRNVNIERIGILYEYMEHYFVMVEVHVGYKIGLRCGFLRRELVGPYLRSEWKALPEVWTGKGFGAGVDETRWSMQSGMIQEMRSACVEAAKAAEEYKKEHGTAWDDVTYKGFLEVTFARKVDTLYFRAWDLEQELVRQMPL